MRRYSHLRMAEGLVMGSVIATLHFRDMPSLTAAEMRKRLLAKVEQEYVHGGVAQSIMRDRTREVNNEQETNTGATTKSRSCRAQEHWVELELVFSPPASAEAEVLAALVDCLRHVLGVEAMKIKTLTKLSVRVHGVGMLQTLRDLVLTGQLDNEFAATIKRCLLYTSPSPRDRG